MLGECALLYGCNMKFDNGMSSYGMIPGIRTARVVSGSGGCQQDVPLVMEDT